VAQPILAKIEVRTQVVDLDVPYRIAAYAAKAGWPPVLGQSEWIIGSDRHASLTRQHRIRSVDGKDIRGRSITGPDAKPAAALPDGRQAIPRLLHPAIEPHLSLGGASQHGEAHTGGPACISSFFL
jgi:hypothetical protein